MFLLDCHGKLLQSWNANWNRHAKADSDSDAADTIMQRESKN